MKVFSRTQTYDLPRFKIDFLCLRDPSDPFTAAPLPNSLCTDLKVDLYTDTVLLVFDPGPSVLFLGRWICHSAITLSTSFTKLT